MVKIEEWSVFEGGCLGEVEPQIMPQIMIHGPTHTLILFCPTTKAPNVTVLLVMSGVIRRSSVTSVSRRRCIQSGLIVEVLLAGLPWSPAPLKPKVITDHT